MRETWDMTLLNPINRNTSKMFLSGYRSGSSSVRLDSTVFKIFQASIYDVSSENLTTYEGRCASLFDPSYIVTRADHGPDGQ